MATNYEQKTNRPSQEMYPFLPPQGNFDATRPNYQHNPPQGGYPVLPMQGHFPPGPPVVNQPTANTGWGATPPNVPNCPPGLEYLSTVDQLLVTQKVELLEVLTGFETQNKYVIRNTLGQNVFFAAEESDCCARNCCGKHRSFNIKILDNYGNEVINLYRPLACQSCWCPCCLQTMEISSPPGTPIGSIQQEWSLCYPNFSIKNASGDTVLRIEGPLCTIYCCGEVEFKVLSPDGSKQVGKISKQWAGLAREAFSDADHFGVTFPMDLDVKMKAVTLGACFLIDMMYFESSPGNK